MENKKGLIKQLKEQLKNIKTEKELYNLIDELNNNGLDLYNKSNNWNSKNYGFIELDDKETLLFTYGVYPICGRTSKIKFKNLWKNFYIK